MPVTKTFFLTKLVLYKIFLSDLSTLFLNYRVLNLSENSRNFFLMNIGHIWYGFSQVCCFTVLNFLSHIGVAQL